MHHLEYGIGRDLDEPFAPALARIREALAAAGFGVISEIDVQATMKAKLGVAVPAHVILGACNPAFAHAALAAEPDLGVLLPCNVDVRETGSGTRVMAVNAGAMMGMIGNEELTPIAEQVQERLERMLASL